MKNDKLQSIGPNSGQVLLLNGDGVVALVELRTKTIHIMKGYYANDFTFPGGYAHFEIYPHHISQMMLALTHG